MQWCTINNVGGGGPEATKARRAHSAPRESSTFSLEQQVHNGGCVVSVDGACGRLNPSCTEQLTRSLWNRGIGRHGFSLGDSKGDNISIVEFPRNANQDTTGSGPSLAQ